MPTVQVISREVESSCPSSHTAKGRLGSAPSVLPSELEPFPPHRTDTCPHENRKSSLGEPRPSQTQVSFHFTR